MQSAECKWNEINKQSLLRESGKKITKKTTVTKLIFAGYSKCKIFFGAVGYLFIYVFMYVTYFRCFIFFSTTTLCLNQFSPMCREVPREAYLNKH